jgi:hypothetical protein
MAYAELAEADRRRAILDMAAAMRIGQADEKNYTRAVRMLRRG